MPHPLDLDTWPRRQAFEHFRRFEQPFFSLCTKVDVAPLETRLRQRRLGSLTLACYHLTLRLAQRIEPFRYRLAGDRVWVHEHVRASTTVLCEGGRLGFATLDSHEHFGTFAAAAAERIRAVRAGEVPFEPGPPNEPLIYLTSLPWVHFTSFTHARRNDPADSVPRLAFGRIDDDGSRRWMPMALDVHHALMDGVHAGEFVQGFEAALAEPDGWLDAA